MALKAMTFLIDEQILADLRTLSSISRITQSDYIREGIGIVLEKYKAELKKKKGGG